MIIKNLTIKVSVVTHSALKEAVKEQRLSISDLGRRYLEAAVERRAWEHGVAPVMPEIRVEIQSKLVKIEERFARLLARTAIEGGVTKRLVLLVLLILTEIRTGTADEIVAWEKEAWDASSRSLYKPLKGLHELLETHRVAPEVSEKPEE